MLVDERTLNRSPMDVTATLIMMSGNTTIDNAINASLRC